MRNLTITTTKTKEGYTFNIYDEQISHVPFIKNPKEWHWAGTFTPNPKCIVCGKDVLHEWLQGDFTLIFCPDYNCVKKLKNFI